MKKPAPIKIWRQPTRRDVEDLCAEKGMRFRVRLSDGGRLYTASGTNGPTYLGWAKTGTRPDWRCMLQILGSDWA